MLKVFKKYYLGLFLVGFLPAVSYGQELALRVDSVQKALATSGASAVTFDLLREIKKQYPQYSSQRIEVKTVRLAAKAGLGGGSVYLVVNNEFNDSQTIETDPALISSSGGFRQIQLANLERAISTMALMFNGEIKVDSIVIGLGSVQDIAVYGSYGQSGQPAPLPPPTTTVPVVVNNPAPQPVRPPPPPPPQYVPVPPANGGHRPVPPPPPAPVVDVRPAQKCLQGFCIGDEVKNAFGFKGKVVAIDSANQELLIKWVYSEEVVARRPDQVKK